MKSISSSAVIGIADDDESVRAALSSLLRSANWKVALYPSAVGLLGDPRRSRIKLVVADIRMPRMDGFSLLDSINGWKRPIPVILITAHATPEVIVRAETCKAAGFFAKPVDDVQLLKLVGDLLGT
jgi:FixJ family two-component response regulator